MFQALIGPISELAGSFMQGQINKQKAKATLAQTKAEAEAEIMIFIPGMEDIVKNGFARLNELPEWYTYLLFLTVSAALGIRGLDKWRKNN